MDIASNTGDCTAFELTAYFTGHVRASGVFEDRFGVVRRRFAVDMYGQFVDGIFLLREDFVYDDGEEQQRTWSIKPGVNGAFTATAGDIVGEVAAIQSDGRTEMAYRHIVNMHGRSVVLSFTDRFYAMDGVSAFSRAVVTKWGIKLGEVSIVYRRVEVARTDSAERMRQAA